MTHIYYTYPTPSLWHYYYYLHPTTYIRFLISINMDINIDDDFDLFPIECGEILSRLYKWHLYSCLPASPLGINQQLPLFYWYTSRLLFSSHIDTPSAWFIWFTAIVLCMSTHWHHHNSYTHLSSGYVGIGHWNKCSLVWIDESNTYPLPIDVIVYRKYQNYWI